MRNGWNDSKTNCSAFRLPAMKTSDEMESPQVHAARHMIAFHCEKKKFIFWSRIQLVSADPVSDVCVFCMTTGCQRGMKIIKAVYELSN